MASRRSPKWLIIVSVALYIGFTVAVFTGSNNWRFGFISLVSGVFGFILKMSGFGFTCTFRAMVTDGDMSQFRDMLVMLFFGTGFCAIVESIEGLRPLFDTTGNASFYDSSAPAGVSVVLGSFLFGIGMQLGSGCASGTFVGIGEGFIKSYVVLPFFVIGSTICATNPFYLWWSELPKTVGPFRLQFGFTLMILIFLFAFTFFFDWVKMKCKKEQTVDSLDNIDRLFSLEAHAHSQPNSEKYVWMKSMLFAACIGVILSLFYLCDGEMIGVTGIFANVGASILKLCGGDPEKWYFFIRDLPNNYLDEIIFDSNIFIALGSFIASTIGRDFGKTQKHGVIEYTKAVFGGLLMGMGSRMSYGCNIGAMTSGITSSSMHGFVWMFFAIIGSLITCQLTAWLERKCKKKACTAYSSVP